MANAFEGSGVCGDGTVTLDVRVATSFAKTVDVDQGSPGRYHIVTTCIIVCIINPPSFVRQNMQ